MTYIFKLLAILSLVMACLGQQSYALTNNKTIHDKVKYKRKPNRRLLVRYKEDTAINKKDEIHFSAGAYVVKSFDLPNNLEVVEVAKGISLKAAEELYKDDPNVLYVERDYELHAYFTPPPTDAPPTDDNPGGIDPKYNKQWGLNNEGQDGGTRDADINAPEMWEALFSDEKPIIAVIDTGVNFNHPDLKNRMWTNPGEIPGNDIDDDGNGVVDDIHGYDSTNASGNPMDDNGHGSHCAGIIGAEGLNRFGGRGVVPNAQIIACKFLDSNGSGTSENAIACLDYLLKLKTRENNPVNIIATSNSWGGGPASQALQDAIQAHQDAGILFIAAASNEGEDNDVVNTYPANYPLANIISVAATDRNDEKASFSNYGRRTVHVGAPGEDILSTSLGEDYETLSGTSMATPFVSGLAGVLYANDTSLNYMQIKNLIMAGGTPIAALHERTISGRRIRGFDRNGLGSLSCENQVVSGRLSPSQDRLFIPTGSSVLLSAININCDRPNGSIVVPAIPLRESLHLTDYGIGIDSAADDGMYTSEWIAQEAGRFEFIFPPNDRVVINVYDTASWGTYTHHEEEVFEYRHIEGVRLDAIDDWTGTISSEFAIKFAGDAAGFDVVNVGSNGALSLTNMDSIDFQNEQLPNNAYMSFIAPMWDDLNPTAGDGGIYYETIGQAPNRELVVEWRDVHHYSSSNGATFQVVFFENSSDILFNYLDTDFGNDSYNDGASATIGLQSTPEHVLQLGHNVGAVKSNQGIRFSIDQGFNDYSMERAGAGQPNML